MPTYEYECTKCSRVFEVFQSITAKPLRTMATECERCNNRAPVQRLIGCGAGVIFKGSGFYETDYRSESYRAGEKAETKAASEKDSSKEGKKESGAKKEGGSARSCSQREEAGPGKGPAKKPA